MALDYSTTEVKDDGLKDVIPVKLPGTNLRLAAREGYQSHLFDYSNTRQPTETEMTHVMSLVIAKLTHTNMSNHFYTFNGKLFKQSKGGAIGSELTGEVSGLYMVMWDQKYLKKLKTLGIHPKCYVRYVDDTLVITDTINKGVRFVKNKLVWSMTAFEEDANTNDDDRTFKLLKAIADSIDKDIQWEADVSSNHSDGKLPCLDLKLWVVGGKSVKFEFYKKPMASKYTLLYRSALSDQIKRSTVFMECYRRLNNCSPDLPWSTKAKHLSDYSYCMMISCYNQTYRQKIIHGTLERYRQMSEMVSDGAKIWYRDRDQIAADKLARGGNSAATWHLRGETTQTMMVPITPNGTLARSVQDRIKSLVGPDRGKTKVIEQGGGLISCPKSPRITHSDRNLADGVKSAKCHQMMTV